MRQDIVAVGIALIAVNGLATAEELCATASVSLQKGISAGDNLVCVLNADRGSRVYCFGSSGEVIEEPWHTEPALAVAVQKGASADQRGKVFAIESASKRVINSNDPLPGQIAPPG